MADFDPIRKPLVELQADDLAALQSVSEGWYVEYKSGVPDVPSIAKSISAFANHYGGWIFYGVAEQSHVPSSFPGIPLTQVTSFLDRIRDAARTFIQPTPHFEHRALNGPAPAISLAADRAIIAVRVPPGHNTPYVHGQGRIYRRVADASDPKHETDRSVLDLLYRRRRRAVKRLQRRLAYLPSLSKAEDDSLSFLQVFLFHDAIEENPAEPITHEQFASVMSSPIGHFAGVPFEVSYPTAAGYIARQVGTNNPFQRGLAWEYDLDGFNSVTIPIHAVDQSMRTSYQHLATFLSSLSSSLNDRVLDFTLLLASLCACIEKYVALSVPAQLHPPYFFKARLVNVWRRVPFLDTKAFLSSVQRFGLPVVQYNKTFAPADAAGITFVPVEHEPRPDLAPDMVSLIRAFGPFARVMEAAGISATQSRELSDLADLLDATRRAAAAYRNQG